MPDFPCLDHPAVWKAADLGQRFDWEIHLTDTEFIDHEATEKRRHILRIWLSMPNSRPLAPWFLDNYGAVEAGVLRGGMKAV